MIGPETALHRALYEALADDAALTALIGPHAIHDRLIERAARPYLVFGPMTTNDWSTASETGFEHVFEIIAWSDAEGRREVQAIAEAVRTRLHEKDLALEAGTLVNLRCERVHIARERRSRRHRAVLAFRAVTEA